MSDIFDHEGDAWNSLMFNEEPGEDGSYLRPHKVDTNHYHKEFTNIKYKKETDKSFLIEFESGKSLWIPKKIMRDVKECSALIHVPTLSKILKSNGN